jgi:hypothetical protein
MDAKVLGVLESNLEVWRARGVALVVAPLAAPVAGLLRRRIIIVQPPDQGRLDAFVRTAV